MIPRALIHLAVTLGASAPFVIELQHGFHPEHLLPIALVGAWAWVRGRKKGGCRHE